MAKRYRYSFTKKKEAKKGKLSAGLAAASFLLGLSSFSEEDRSHKTSIIGSISNGLILIVWIGVYLTGL